ncbi:hypothetical protein C4546_03405 [Candidatus Parcubacteria bacterium]|jgi:Tfp pilus assembly protein PilE|nr:MAG: hypothetical protein C4546_03405 [Candidatus Parcubacteria bacterium]
MGNQKGFTLTELFVILIIIAILAVLAIPHYTKTRDRAVCKDMLAEIYNAEKAYHQLHGAYAFYWNLNLSKKAGNLLKKNPELQAYVLRATSHSFFAVTNLRQIQATITQDSVITLSLIE